MSTTGIFCNVSFYHWLENHWLEIFAALTGITYVWLEVRLKAVMWIVGFISSLIYVVVYIQSSVYGYAALNAYYTLASVYGWYCWRFGRSRGENAGLLITRLQMPLALILIGLTVVLYVVISYTLQYFTDSPLPYYESLAAALSVIATWMVARKIIEHWYLWMFINLFSAVLFLHLKLYPTVVLYIIYVAMSVQGWRQWKKTLFPSPAIS
jgi:nicotinamide mononucleotide transporter